MKKNFILNTDICDARNMKEEDYKDYEQIILNADILLLNEESKSILNRLPVLLNVDDTIELPDNASFSVINGSYEITPSTETEENPFLLVNGCLTIQPNTQEQLKRYRGIRVNGIVKVPEGLAGLAQKLGINGKLTVIPDGCVELQSDFIIDKYFPLRARRDQSYFAEKRVRLLDLSVDLSPLKEKHIFFRTPKLLAPEERLPQLLELFDETTDLEVIPDGCAYVDGDATLDKAFLTKYGPRVYVDGSLTLDADSTPYIPSLKQLVVAGDVELLQDQLEAFRQLNAVYQNLTVVKGRVIKNAPMVTVDAAMIEKSPEGVLIKNCAYITLKNNVTPENILETLQFENCAMIKCSPEQKSALQLISKNIAQIDDGEKSQESGGILGMIKKMADSKLVNADHYHL